MLNVYSSLFMCIQACFIFVATRCRLQINTVPQGVIDMNVCVDVFDAESATSHEFSICVATADKKTYIKGTNKEEITRSVV